MNYAAVVRELHNRLRWHAQAGRMLDGLTVRKSGEYAIDGDGDLPHILLVDMSVNDTRGQGTGQVTFWLRVARRHGWFREEGEDPNKQKFKGLLDWMLHVMDAMETPPSDTSKADQLLIAHDENGALLPTANEPSFTLLSDPFTWQSGIDEINEMYHAMQLTLSFTITTTKRATRRNYPPILPMRLR